MATKRFCDCCGKEVKNRGVVEFSLRKHIPKLATDGLDGQMYVDRDGDVVSDASEAFDLCNRCYNKVALAAMQKILELQTDYVNCLK